MQVKDINTKVLDGFGTKDSKRGTLVTDKESGKSLDELLTTVGKGDKLTAALVSKTHKTLRISTAADIKEARKLLTIASQRVADRAKAAPKPKPKPAAAKPKASTKAKDAAAEAKKLDAQVKQPAAKPRKTGVVVEA